MTDADAAWPTELKVAAAGRMLNVSFDDGASFELPAEYLRVMSPSAEVQGHSRKERRILGGKRHVAIIGVEPIGTYAVKLRFDDMHATGIYSWTYLRNLGETQANQWAAYLAAVAKKGLSRDRAGESVADDH